ncbi:hypothetical protein GGI43DRAFT_398372 [Trichoderma evansii]
MASVPLLLLLAISSQCQIKNPKVSKKKDPELHLLTLSPPLFSFCPTFFSSRQTVTALQFVFFSSEISPEPTA